MSNVRKKFEANDNFKVCSVCHGVSHPQACGFEDANGGLWHCLECALELDGSTFNHSNCGCCKKATLPGSQCSYCFIHCHPTCLKQVGNKAKMSCCTACENFLVDCDKCNNPFSRKDGVTTGSTCPSCLQNQRKNLRVDCDKCNNPFSRKDGDTTGSTCPSCLQDNLKQCQTCSTSISVDHFQKCLGCAIPYFTYLR